MAKGEVAHHETFLLLPQCFPKVSAVGVSESICMFGNQQGASPNLPDENRWQLDTNIKPNKGDFWLSFNCLITY